MKSKLIGVPSSGNLFDTNVKKNAVNKMFYKNFTKKLTNEKISKENTANDSIHLKSDLIKKTSSGNINTNDYVINSMNKSKIVAKISRSVLNSQNFKN